MADTGSKNGTGSQSEMEDMGEMGSDMYQNMSPFMMMKIVFKLKEKVAKLEGMMKVIMHTQMGGSSGGCSCGCCHR